MFLFSRKACMVKRSNKTPLEIHMDDDDYDSKLAKASGRVERWYGNW